MADPAEKKRAPRNRTVTLTAEERSVYEKRLVPGFSRPAAAEDILGRTVNADLFSVLDFLPAAFVDLLILDPPYNLNKAFGSVTFSRTDDASYMTYLRSWFPRLLPALKPGASVYLCGDWQNSCCLYSILKEHLTVRNRITWQREKGRGSRTNWKNSSEDIWFATAGGGWYFDPMAVKQKRRVLAPYRENGKPKDWEETADGNFRLTYQGNFWDDISVPYWSMPENTDHPTQKPEKLIAKLILASSPPGAVVFDPFLGSGTTSVVAKKLGRRYCGIELDTEYCCIAEKRLEQAKPGAPIQGYSDGVFWERNTFRFRRVPSPE